MRTLAVVCCAVLLCSVCSASTVEDSSMFRGNPEHSGSMRAGAVPKGKVAWSIKTGNKVRSSAAVASGTAYFGSNDGSLYAIDVHSGRTLWRASVSSPIPSSPAVAANLILFQSADGVLHALDARAGTPKWKFETGPQMKFEGRWDYYVSSPVVANETVFFGAGDGHVYALSLRDGKQIWSFKTQGVVRATPAVSDGIVYAGSMDGHLYALDAKSGSLKWKFKTAGNKYFPVGEVQSSPAVAYGNVYFGSRDATLYVLDAKTGEKKWVNLDSTGAWVITSPAISNDLVVIGSSDGKFVQALDARTGQMKWKQNVMSNVFASPLIANGVVYVADWYGAVQWFDLHSGKALGGYLVDGPIQSSPVFADTLLLFGSDNDEFYAVK